MKLSDKYFFNNHPSECLDYICLGRRTINCACGLRFFVQFFRESWEATGYDVCVYIIYEHRAISCIGPRGQAGANPYRGCLEIVRKSCNCSAVSVQFPQLPHEHFN